MKQVTKNEMRENFLRILIIWQAINENVTFTAHH